MPKYQYKDELEAVSLEGYACPPETAKEQEREAWRFVFNPMTDSCFFPVAAKNPSRLLNARDAEVKCSCWGVSLYETKAEALRAFAHLERNFKNIRKNIGDHIAHGRLDSLCGVSTSADQFGHFDLHPYTTADLSSTFRLAGALP